MCQASVWREEGQRNLLAALRPGAGCLHDRRGACTYSCPLWEEGKKKKILLGGPRSFFFLFLLLLSLLGNKLQIPTLVCCSRGLDTPYHVLLEHEPAHLPPLETSARPDPSSSQINVGAALDKNTAKMVKKIYVTYNDVHKLCKESAEKLLADFQPHLMVAIGGGGYVPARILRSFLKKPGSPNIPIQAIGLSLYEALGNDSQVETLGTKVTRTQWLDLSSLGEMENLIGKRVLIVDEVDDTRTTLEYAVKELEKDVELARERLGGNQPKAEFSIFVLHNKDKQKKGVLPTTWSLPDVIWLPAPSETSGSATPGRPSTSRSMTGSPRRTATRSRRLWERDDKRKT
uniref:Phosphoribosyltransferase domain-containing protein n=1 Tax=Bionectria ochroleuca TaxID=29856 RepID=A0A8H7TJY6_BIOOC